jgi:hypothetical protein
VYETMAGGKDDVLLGRANYAEAMTPQDLDKHLRTFNSQYWGCVCLLMHLCGRV